MPEALALPTPEALAQVIADRTYGPGTWDDADTQGKVKTHPEGAHALMVQHEIRKAAQVLDDVRAAMALHGHAHV